MKVQLCNIKVCFLISVVQFVTDNCFVPVGADDGEMCICCELNQQLSWSFVQYSTNFM
jgi:hypothetical protein